VSKPFLAATVLAGICACSNAGAFAQDKASPPAAVVLRSPDDTFEDRRLAQMHQEIDSVKRQVIAANLTLTDSEATKFWPVYDQYSAEFTKITEKKNALIKEYAEEYGSMTDEEADSLVRRWLDADIAAFELRRKYLPIFRKVLGARTTATFFQVEHQVDAMIDLRLTSQLPLIQSQDQSPNVQ